MAKLLLVGAGPGDPELITIKGVQALKRADVVLYDALANDILLDYCRPDTVKQFVGKRNGHHALIQSEINLLISEYAASYETIVRLKGGDPFVFGRAQEEIDAALNDGMEVEVIPGISSALAVPASQLIPLTCRGISESFWVVTGMTSKGDLSQDIFLAAQSSATVVILMAMNRLAAICDIFMRYGKADTPAAIIQEGTQPGMKMVTGKIKDIAFRARQAGLLNPAVIVFGEVVNINRNLLKEILPQQLSIPA